MFDVPIQGHQERLVTFFFNLILVITAGKKDDLT